MLEKLLQAAVITLLLSMLAGIGMPKSTETPNSIFHALSLPLVTARLNLFPAQ